MRGIDISNHKYSEGLHDLSEIMKSADFCICKATGGASFVDYSCDYYIQQLIKLGKPWGFYHFANDDYEGYSAEREADFFIENCRNYFGKGIPILDWETATVNASWVNRFVRRVHDKTGVWCWIYSWPRYFNDGGIEANCGRWIAYYPNVTSPGLDYTLPEVPNTDGTVCAWQYASDGRVEGFSGNLDINVFFGDAESWGKYARGDGGDTKPIDDPNIEVLENERYTVTISKK